MFKKTLFVLGLFLFGSYVWAAQVFISPNLKDPRFEPANKLHAWCDNSATVSIKTSSKEAISSFRFVLSYEPQNIEILEILPNEKYKDIMDSKIEYDKVVVSMLNREIAQWETTELFDILFKSNEFTTESTLAIHKPSYVIDQSNKEILVFVEQKLSFEKVEECNPDIIAPKITLKKPENPAQLLAMDGYFVFEITDEWKWVDQNSVIIDFAQEIYSGDNPALVWKDNQLFFYPSKRIPIWENLDLTISVADKQKYWGANITSESLSFKSYNRIVFESEINPAQYRNLIDKSEKIYANADECDSLNLILNSLNNQNFSLEYIENLAEKVNCKIDKSKIAKQIEENQESVRPVEFISAFSLFGWTMFAISFALLINYLILYKKASRISPDSESKDQNHFEQ